MVVKASHALRSNSRCTGRYIEGLRHGHHTAINRTRSPSRLCDSVQFLAIGRRTERVAMDTRRPRRDARLCRRCALPRWREAPRHRQL
jgi:hypothetical protein